MLEEKCRQLEQLLDLQTKQPSNGVLGNSSELSQPEENITTMQSVQESFHQELASKNEQLESLKHNLELAQANQSMVQFQSL